MSKWNFISNHTMALLLINRDNLVTVRQMAEKLGVIERFVRRIIKDLQIEGYLQIEKEGRSNRYKVNHNVLLRRQALGSTTVGELMDTLSQDFKAIRNNKPDSNITIDDLTVSSFPKFFDLSSGILSQRHSLSITQYDVPYLTSCFQGLNSSFNIHSILLLALVDPILDDFPD